jgi:hypothetical protein
MRLARGGRKGERIELFWEKEAVLEMHSLEGVYGV